MAARAGEGTQALEKALDVLDAIGSAPNGLSQAEVTQRLALPRTTVYRLLATLVERGFVRRDPVRRVYCLGFRCFEMARQVYAMPDLVAAAAIELRALRDLTGETTYLATLDGVEAISLERFDGAHSQRSQAVPGQRKPIHCTSQGKAILAALDDGARNALLRDLTLKPLTPRTITDRRRLQAEIKATIARGYAIDDEEIVVGVCCVGAAIVDPAGRVRGSISVAGPSWRLTPERLQLLGPEVAEAARRIGAQLQQTRAEGADVALKVLPGPWAFHGAHPLWHPQHRRLYWADVLAPALHRVSGAADHVLASFDQPIVGLVLQAGTVCVVHAQGIVVVDEDGSACVTERRVPAGLSALCNGDGDLLWAAVRRKDGGTAVGRLQTDGHLDVRWRLPDVLTALRWRASDGTLFATASEAGSILMLQPGTAGVRRLATVPRGSGLVSGLAFDDGGGVWTALRGGWNIMRFSADGGLDRVVGLPVPCPTDLAVDGEGEWLYVLSARQPVPLDILNQSPLSGRLFRMRLQ